MILAAHYVTCLKNNIKNNVLGNIRVLSFEKIIN